MGIVMPHSTPKAEIAAEASMPPATSLFGIRTELAELISVASREVQLTGMEMEKILRQVMRSALGRRSTRES